MFFCCCFEEPMVYHARSTSASYSLASTPTTKTKIVGRKSMKIKVLVDKNKSRGEANSSFKKNPHEISNLKRIVEEGKN